MREILFKAKRVDNGEWVEGFYTEQWHKTTGGDIPEDTWLHIMYPAIEQCEIEPEGYEVIPETVCQYTGLRDKNGQRIFEGDYLREYEEIEPYDSPVTWQLSSFTIGNDEMSEILMDQETASMYRVSGNIHSGINDDGDVFTGNIHDTTEDTE